MFSGSHLGVDYGSVLDGYITRQLIAEQIMELDKLFIEKEVIRALKDMHPTKAPRPDSFHALFYQQY